MELLARRQLDRRAVGVILLLQDKGDLWSTHFPERKLKISMPYVPFRDNSDLLDERLIYTGCLLSRFQILLWFLFFNIFIFYRNCYMR